MRLMGTRTVWTLPIMLVVFLFCSIGALAAPVGPEKARLAVEGWMNRDTRPMESAQSLSGVSSVRAFADQSGETVYYVVDLRPAGFAVVSADDELEPIVAFQTSGSFAAAPGAPLYDMVQADMSGRMHGLVSAKAHERKQAVGQSSSAGSRWAVLLSAAGATPDTRTGTPSISDVRVNPLIQSKWNQAQVAGVNVYNYYTPNHYVCGCAATALSQVLRFHRHHTDGVGTPSFTVHVDGAEQTLSLRGGDGAGGPYDWDDMPLVPDENTTLAQRQAIGTLTYDAGVCLGMSYSSEGSGTDALKTAVSLRDTFGYAGAVRGKQGGYNISSILRDQMVNPNLDAGLPVLFGIESFGGGHAIVADGYGYQDGTAYHHLNMGWSGADDVWYNLPTIDATHGFFYSVRKIVYNIHPTVSGEIISGRVLDDSGAPVSGVTVTATMSGGASFSDITDEKGIYGIIGLPSSTRFTLEVTGEGYSFKPRTVRTEASSFAENSDCGNVWGANFPVTPSSLAPCLLPILH